jgi:2-keto-3-deoxy-6-phosphogluconate aldolase
MQKLTTMEINLISDSFWGSKKKTSFWDRLFRRNKTINKALSTPEMISKNCRGLLLGNENLKSFLFSTDMALIENNDADAILAVYPFPPSPKIIKTLIDFSGKAVVCGVGGGTTKGKKSLEMAIYAEQAGAAGIIVNIPFENKDVKKIREKISIPIIATVTTSDYNFLKGKIEAGVNVFHVSGGSQTTKIVKEIAEKFPDFPVMATGGKSLENIEESINSGSRAIVLSPPSNKDLFKTVMDKYRNNFANF